MIVEKGVIGANIFCKIKMKKKPRVGGSVNTVAEITKFGWVLMSPGSEIQSRVYLTTHVRTMPGCAVY